MKIGSAVRHTISGYDEKKSGSKLKPGQHVWNALIEPKLNINMLMSQSGNTSWGISFL
jgi:hypothetical protein